MLQACHGSSQCCHRLAAYLDKVRLWLRIHDFRSPGNTSKIQNSGPAKDYGSLLLFFNGSLRAGFFYQKIHRADSKHTNFDYLCIFRGNTASCVILRGNPAPYLLDLTSFIQCFLDKPIEISVNDTLYR